MPKIPIDITLGQEGEDTMTYAYQMRDMLDRAGFGAGADTGIWGIERYGDRVMTRDIGDTGKAPSVWILCYTTNSRTYVSANPYISYVTTFLTNNFKEPLVTNNDPHQIYDAIYLCLTEIGIPVRHYPTTKWVKPGEFEIYIPLKNN